jgi:hypothetical protein
MHWNGRSACWISKVFEIREGGVFQTMTICLFACTLWLVGITARRGHACCSFPSGSSHYRAVSNTLTFHFLNRLSVGRAWNPFVHEYWQFLTVYALFRIGLYRYFQRCVWRHDTEKDYCLLFGEWINQHRLLLLIIFVPLIPEIMSLGYAWCST